jgi:predicted RNA-binding protein with PUA-like domain
VRTRRFAISKSPMKKYWLMKSEPEVFSIDDLSKLGEAPWDGVRNYQARNFMMNDMKVGDEVLFYHSSSEPPGVAGLAKVVAEAAPDVTQFDKKSEYFDPKASKDKPRWFCVKVGFVEKFPQLVELSRLRDEKALKDMPLFQKGQRLSVQPVGEKEFNWIVKNAR